MALKRYVIIDNDTSIVLLNIQYEETQVNQMYPNNLVVEIPEPGAGQPVVRPGFMYHNNKFWVPMAEAPTPTRYSLIGFRRLFTVDEQIRIDNYMMDAALTDDQKKQMTTMLKNLEGASDPGIELNDPLIAAGLDFLISINYIATSRLVEITAGKIPA